MVGSSECIMCDVCADCAFCLIEHLPEEVSNEYLMKMEDAHVVKHPELFNRKMEILYEQGKQDRKL